MVILYLLANVPYLALLSFPEIQQAPQNRVARRSDEGRLRAIRRDVHGRRDYDFNVRL